MVGLFGVVESATLDGITLTNATITGTGTVTGSVFTFAGALVGVAQAGTTIVDSSASGLVTGSGSTIGGLVGEAGTGTVIDSSSSSAVVSAGFGGVNAGGLVGQSDPTTGDLTIRDSHATGSVTAGGPMGGLIGWVIAPATIERSLATGNVSGATFGRTSGGGLVGQVVTDDTQLVTISQSFALGNIAVTNGFAGGLVGQSGDDDFPTEGGLVVSDSYASGQVVTTCDATCPSGGILGHAQSGGLVPATITNSYSTSDIQPGGTTPAGGGILGGSTSPGAAVITDSFWNPTDAGPAATAVFGTESTQGAMRSPSLFASAGWSISDRAPAATTWTSCAAYNSGNPILQWYATAQGWSCASPPPPPPIYPPSAPLDVAGIAGDDAAAVSWLTPASSGSFTVSNYQVVAAPGGRSCLTSTLTCAVTGLANGTAYTFTVRALNGAGWGPWSAASATVTPGAPTVMISGVRAQVRGRPGVIVSGTSTLQMGAILRPWVKFPGPTTFGEGSAQVLADESGDFTWQRRTGKRTGKKVYVYMTAGDLTSNRIVIRP